MSIAALSIVKDPKPSQFHLCFLQAPYKRSLQHHLNLYNLNRTARANYCVSCPRTGFICSERSVLSKAFHKQDKRFVRSRLHLNVACRAGMIMMPVGEPLVRYRNPEGGYQWVDLTNALLRDRVVCLSQFIDDDFSNAILGTLLYLDTVDPGKVLNMLVLGAGGDVQSSLQIYDTMESLASPIATYGLGYLNNLSGHILAAGDKGKRNMMFSANITIEPISGVARGNADDIINEANELARIRDYLFKQLELKTGQPFEKIKKDLQRSKTFSAQEALDYGLVDEILRYPDRVSKAEKIEVSKSKKKVLKSRIFFSKSKEIGDGLG